MNKRTEETTQLSTQLLACRSPQDADSAAVEFGRKSWDDYVQEWLRLGQLARQATDAVTRIYAKSP
ncbi:MAG: phasin family protein [Hyphomicrobiaceae bacterium]